MTFNTRVQTPIGAGVVKGYFTVRADNGEAVTRGVLVRMPVTETTQPHLRDSNCMTPHATQHALWVFAETDLR